MSSSETCTLAATGWPMHRAPSDVIRGLLPLHDQLVHCRWSGQGCWIPFGEDFLDLAPENATSHPAPGPAHRLPRRHLRVRDTCSPTAASTSRSVVGQLWGNHFLTLDEGLEQLRGARPPRALGGRPAHPHRRGRLTWRPTCSSTAARSSRRASRSRATSRSGTAASAAVHRASRSGRRRSAATGRAGRSTPRGCSCCRARSTSTRTRACPSERSARPLLRGLRRRGLRRHDDVPRLQQPGHRHQRVRAAHAAGRHRRVARRHGGRERRRRRAVGGHHRPAGGARARHRGRGRGRRGHLQGLLRLRLRRRCGAARRAPDGHAPRRRAAAGPRRGPRHARRGHRARARGGPSRPRFHAASRPPEVEAPAPARPSRWRPERRRAGVLRARHLGGRSRPRSPVPPGARPAGHGRDVPAVPRPRRVRLRASPDEECTRYVISPPLRSAGRPGGALGGAADGLLDLVATDSVPDHLADEKRWQGQPFDRISNGAPGIETLLPVVWGRGVATVA